MVICTGTDWKQLDQKLIKVLSKSSCHRNHESGLEMSVSVSSLKQHSDLQTCASRKGVRSALQTPKRTYALSVISNVTRKDYGPSSSSKRSRLTRPSDYGTSSTARAVTIIFTQLGVEVAVNKQQ